MICLEKLGVTFNPGTVLEHQALKRMDLRVEQGEFVTVIGSNGAGKTTLLNLVSGELMPSNGEIWLGEQRVTSLPVHKRAGLAARVFQDPLAGTCWDLSIEENMALARSRGSRRGMALALDSKIRASLRERLAALGLGLENRLGDQMGLLSGGQRQAISLIMATLARSDILLLDEHTAALDPRMAAFVLDLTDGIYREYQPTILMVTHSMRDALAHGSRTIMLHQGEVVFDITGKEREGTSVNKLLTMFSQVRGEKLEDDALLLS